MKSIIVIIPYFGDLPPMFTYWKQSALNNPTVDFLLVTDNNIESNANIHVLHWTFQECRNYFQSLYDFPIALDRPYKLCDFKPAYGDIFKEYIRDYDFWGFGDLDLVYGDIRYFFTPDILNRYWVISGWGHLSLYRNTTECNQFYKKDIDGFINYKEVFSNTKQFVFDEYLHGGMADRWKTLMPDRLWPCKAFDDVVIPRIHYNFKSHKREFLDNLIFEYKDGVLFRVYSKNGAIAKEQSLYAHFQQRKFMQCKANNLNHFLIIPNQFIDYFNYSFENLEKWGNSQRLNQLFFNIKYMLLYKIRKIKKNL